MLNGNMVGTQVVHQPDGIKPAWGRWLEGFPQAVGDEGGQLHPKMERCGRMFRLVAEASGGGSEGLKGILRVPLPCPSVCPQCS